MPTRDDGNSGPNGHSRVATERRRELRAGVDGALRSDYGRILDLSLHGMRVLSTRHWDENAVHRVCIQSDKRKVVVDAACRWCRQEGRYDHLVGLAFVDLSEAQLGVLELLLDDNGTALL